MYSDDNETASPTQGDGVNSQAAQQKIHVTFFASQGADRLTTESLRLDEIRERILHASRRKKKELPWLKLAKFGKLRTDKNSLRHDGNVLEITGVELDYDSETVSFDDTMMALRELNISALAHTSPSHTPEAPRYRIIAPTSKPLPPSMRGGLVARLNGFMKSKLGIDKFAATESFTLSQSFYYGWTTENQNRAHRAEVTTGAFIDERDDLAQYEALGAKVDEQKQKAGTGDGAATNDQGRAHGFDAILATMGDGDGLQGFNDPLVRAAASYVTMYYEQLDEKKLKKILRDAIAKAPKKDTPERAESVERYKSDKYLNDIIASAIKKYIEALPVTLAHFVADMETHSYIYKPTRKPWPAASVNARIKPVSLLDADGRPILDSKKKPKKVTASEWLDKHHPIEAVTWAPGEPMVIRDKLVDQGGWFDHLGASVLNLYRPSSIILGDRKQAGPWIDHVKKVYPNDAQHIISWSAFKVQHPDRKINHALFLGGAQGIGKDTILEGVKRAVGSWNFIEVSPQDIAGSTFTGYLKSVVLRISEVHDLGDVNRFSFYEMTKTIIAAPPDVHRINEKHRPEYYIPNVNGVIITSNYLTNGIYLPPDDRRHYIAWSDCTQGDFEAGYFDKLYEWYEKGGDRHVAAYLKTLDLSGFNAKAPPKKTEAFYSIANANAAPEEVELVEVIDRLKNPKAVTIKQITNVAESEEQLQDFAGWITDRKNRRAIPHRMAQAGYLPVRNPGDKSGLWKVRGSKQVAYAQKELSLHDQIGAVQEMIKNVEAHAKAQEQADADVRAEAQAKRKKEAHEQAKADAQAREQMRSQVQVKAQERAQAEAKKRLSGGARRALDLLIRCINDSGRPAPANKQFPERGHVVSLTDWLMTCERGGLSSAGQREDRDRAFWQAKDELQTASWIACWDGLVWLDRYG